MNIVKSFGDRLFSEMRYSSHMQREKDQISLQSAHSNENICCLWAESLDIEYISEWKCPGWMMPVCVQIVPGPTLYTYA